MREFRIGRLNGGYVVTWHEDGKRRRFRLDALTRKTAEAEALDVIRRETLPPGPAKIEDLWAAYLAEKSEMASAAQMRSTAGAVLGHFGALRPDQVTTEHCRAYVAARRKAGLADGTIWTHLGYLRNTLNWATRAGLIDRAPYIERPSQPAPKDRYLTRAEIERLLAADAEPHIALAILLMLSTAARVTAILELTWDRVDLGRSQINLRLDAEGTRKGRAVVPINKSLRAALVTASQAATSDHVIEWAGQPVRSIKKGFASAVKSSGLSDVTPHVLRHTAAVHMAEAGIPMSEISQYLGHSNVRVTETVYARFSPQHLRRAADVLDFSKVRKVQ